MMADKAGHAMSEPVLFVDSSDAEIIAAMGQARGFVPALVIACRIDREHGRIVAVLRSGHKVFWSFTLITPHIYGIPIEAAPESIVEAPSEDEATIAVVEAPAEPPSPRKERAGRRRRPKAQ